MTKEKFIEKAKEIYGDKYDYSCLPEGKFLSSEKVIIICPKHGKFQKSYDKHISGRQGCPICMHKHRRTNKEFIDEINEMEHLKNCTFEKTFFKSTKEKVIITCHEQDENGIEHGEFLITPRHILDGQGCPKCRYIKSAKGRRRTVDDVIEAAKRVHGDKYDYSKVTDYKNDRIKYTIICPKHGDFKQAFNNHIKGKQGCPICGRELSDKERKMSFNEFVEIASKVHENKFTYVEETFNGSENYVDIICPYHGKFTQKASNHINLKHGCPKCACASSRGEESLVQYIESIFSGKIIKSDRDVLGGRELDILLPEEKIAFEYDGLYWHCEKSKTKNYHLDKTRKCEETGVRLFHVFEDEWLQKTPIVKSMILNLLGKIDNKIYARKCTIKEVSSSDARNFFEENHLQGSCPSSIRYGLYYNGEIVSLMAFGKSRHFIGNGKHEWELLRFCNKINTNVEGGASKLFKHFIKMHNPQEIISYADRRWSNGNLYSKLGFIKYNESKPSYYYIMNGKRIYRFNMRKSILMKKYGCPKEISEQQFCYSKGWYRIYDCGCLCFIWNSKEN